MRGGVAVDVIGSVSSDEDPYSLKVSSIVLESVTVESYWISCPSILLNR
jgi:hypothetical protein